MRSNKAPVRPRARTFGLKKMEAAGKTGTAYDFTDVLFAGYDSAITARSGLGSISRSEFSAARSGTNRAAGMGGCDERRGRTLSAEGHFAAA